MEVRRATYDEAKRLKEFDVLVGEHRLIAGPSQLTVILRLGFLVVLTAVTLSCADAIGSQVSIGSGEGGSGF